MKNKVCKNCQYYTAYYKRWSDHYGRLTNGYCRKKQIPQIQFESCEQYVENTQLELQRTERLLKSLEQALTSINHIALILAEKQTENKD